MKSHTCYVLVWLDKAVIAWIRQTFDKAEADFTDAGFGHLLGDDEPDVAGAIENDDLSLLAGQLNPFKTRLDAEMWLGAHVEALKPLADAARVKQAIVSSFVDEEDCVHLDSNTTAATRKILSDDADEWFGDRLKQYVEHAHKVAREPPPAKQSLGGGGRRRRFESQQTARKRPTRGLEAWTKP